MINLLNFIKMLIGKTKVINIFIFVSFLFVVIIVVQPWNISHISKKFSIEKGKTKIYNKIDKEKFREEVFGYDINNLKALNEYIFGEDNKNVEIKKLDVMTLGSGKKYKSKEGVLRDYIGDPLEGEEIVESEIVIKELFSPEDFNSLFNSIGLQGKKFNLIYSISQEDQKILIDLYKNVLNKLNKSYNGYIVYNKNTNSQYLYFVIKTAGELIDDGIDENDLHKDIGLVYEKLYGIINEMISSKYAEISKLAQVDKGMFNLLKNYENINEMFQKKSTYIQGQKDILVFNFIGDYDDFENYIKQYMATENFINKTLFNKLFLK